MSSASIEARTDELGTGRMGGRVCRQPTGLLITGSVWTRSEGMSAPRSNRIEHRHYWPHPRN